MPWFVRAERNNTKLSKGIQAETLDSAYRIKANFEKHGWHDVKIVDEDGRGIENVR